MPKIKLLIIGLMITIFSVFNGFQVAAGYKKGWFAGFILTFLFFSIVFHFQTLYDIVASSLLTEEQLKALRGRISKKIRENLDSM